MKQGGGRGGKEEGKGKRSITQSAVRGGKGGKARRKGKRNRKGGTARGKLERRIEEAVVERTSLKKMGV